MKSSPSSSSSYCCKINLIKKANETDALSQAVKSDEDERCSADLLYMLFVRPRHRNHVLRHVLEGCYSVITTKYSPAISQVSIFCKVRDILIDKSGDAAGADDDLRMFMFLVALMREEEFQEMVRRSFKPQGNPWGDVESAHAHFNLFLTHLKRILEPLATWPTEDHNGEDVVANTVHIARKIYLTE